MESQARSSARGGADLLALADVMLGKYLRYLAGYGGTVLEEDGLLLFAGPHAQPNPYRNGVLRLDDTVSARDALDRSGEFFAERRRGFAVWAREHGDDDLHRAAASAELMELERLPELILEELPPYVRPPDGVELRRATDEQTREDFLAVIADAWGMRAMPRDVAARVFLDPDSLDLPNVAAFVAYYDGVALSAANFWVSDGVAVGGHGGTVSHLKPGQRLPPRMPAGERRSLHAHCTWKGLEVGFGELGARLSVSQASEQGARVLEGLGFRPFTGYARYLVPASAARGRRV